jgi:hypothetical protein
MFDNYFQNFEDLFHRVHEISPETRYLSRIQQGKNTKVQIATTKTKTKSKFSAQKVGKRSIIIVST